MAFIQEMFPAVYEKTYKFLNALDYINLRLTGRFVCTVDSILTSWVTDNRDIAHIHYDRKLVRQSGISPEKLPEIVRCTDVIGQLTRSVSLELGVPESTPVVAGSVDNSAAAVGSGAVADGEAHIYIGTSSWIGAHVPFKKTDIFAQIASVPCALNSRYLAIAVQSSAGSNLSFLCNQVLYRDSSRRASDVYSVVEEAAASVPAGSRGLMYTPWIFGERSPVDDPSLRAAYLNLSLQHTSADIIRATLEGVALNTRWMVGPFSKFLGKRIDQVTLVGGGATSNLWCQIFADVLNIPVKQTHSPIQTNAIGAGLIGYMGIGALTYEDIADLALTRRTYLPDSSTTALYDDSFERFQFAYKRLAPLYKRWNRTGAAQS
jgi:xylulokinase